MSKAWKSNMRCREIERAASLDEVAALLEEEAAEFDAADPWRRSWPALELDQATLRIVDLMAETAPQAYAERKKLLDSLDGHAEVFAETAGAFEVARTLCEVKGPSALEGGKGAELAGRLRALIEILSPSEASFPVSSGHLGELLGEYAEALEGVERPTPRVGRAESESFRGAILRVGQGHAEVAETRSRAPLALEAAEREPRLAAALSALFERTLSSGSDEDKRQRLMEDFGLDDNVLRLGEMAQRREGAKP